MHPTNSFQIGHLVEEARKALMSARILLEGRRPDRAYLDYLIASEIIVNRIPRHKDYVDLQGNRGEKHRQNRELVKVLNAILKFSRHELIFYTIFLALLADTTLGDPFLRGQIL